MTPTPHSSPDSVPPSNRHDVREPHAVELPADLVSLARSLDALAAADSAAAPLGMEDRIWAGSRGHVAATPPELMPMVSGLEELSVSERSSASDELEPRAFELSREAIAGGRPLGTEPTLRIAGSERDERSAVVVVDRFRLVRRLSVAAAAVALAGLGIGAYVASRPFNPGAPASDSLAERLDRELSSLYEAVELSKGEVGSASSRETNFELDSSWLNEIYTEESL